MNTSKVTRIEVIDHTHSLEEGGGRTYVHYQEDIKLELVLQDDDRTLKILISKLTKQQ